MCLRCSGAGDLGRMGDAVMDVALSSIQMDASIQCRASIDTGTVNEYAERMTAADAFPPVELFGADGRYWIGDGWHRIMAARQIGALSIDATAHDGGRREALKFALGANAQHGHRRTNADKRRCVEIALAEFGSLSNNAVAALCGVHDEMVSRLRSQLPESGTSKVIGADGKQYPARRKERTAVNDDTQTTLTRSSPRDEKVAAIKALITTGHNPEQISEATALTLSNVRLIIRECGLAEIKRRGRGAAKLDAAHVIEETVNAIVATTHGLRLVRNAAIEIDKDEAAALLVELRDSMKSLQWLTTKLKELSQ